MLEVIARKSDASFGPGTKNGASLLFQEFLINFGSGFSQIGQQIWNQRMKTMKIDYLLVFFEAWMRKHDFRGKGYCSGGRGIAGNDGQRRSAAVWVMI